MHLKFSDNGHGISRENLSKIFEPFFSTKGGKTIGLGLAVSWDIIDQHGGRIDVASEVGIGMTFHIWLQCAPLHPVRWDSTRELDDET